MTVGLALLSDGVMIPHVMFSAVPVGTTRELSLEVKNLNEFAVFDLLFSVDHPDVVVLIAPKELGSGEVAPLLLSYTPKVQVDKGISAKLLIKGFYEV